MMVDLRGWQVLQYHTPICIRELWSESFEVTSAIARYVNNQHSTVIIQPLRLLISTQVEPCTLYPSSFLEGSADILSHK